MSQIKTTNFWLAWIFASLLVYPITAIFVFAFSMIWFTAAQALFPAVNQAGFLSDVYTLATIIAFGGVIALAVGMLQANVLKRYFHFTPQNWQRATVIGGLVAAPVTGFIMFGLNDYMSVNYWELVESGQFEILSLLLNVLPMMMYVTVMSVVQAIVLREYVSSAWLWIVANAVAGLMFSMLAMVTFDPGFGDWLLAAIAQGAITGFAMLWLLHRLTKEEEEADEPEFAYQHVPIDIDDD